MYSGLGDIESGVARGKDQLDFQLTALGLAHGLTEIELARAAGKIGVLFDMDYQGARQIKEKFPHALGVFILPPSMEELRRRLDGRGSDDADSRQRRFDNAREEIGHYPLFDYMVVNDELQRALTELRGIVLAEGCRQWRVAARAESLLQQ